MTEYYAGLLRSSPKVTCHLSRTPITLALAEQRGANSQFDSWECEVCAYRNPPGLSPAAARICALCGVPRMVVPTPLTPVPPNHVSSSLPSSTLSSSTSLPQYSHSSSGHKGSAIACPACTFLNYPSLRSCEICSTELPLPKGEFRSAPSSRPITPDSEGVDAQANMIKLSFRKGGDKPLYATLKRSLKSKAWEVRLFSLLVFSEAR
jgi:ESCRT-II complex subunit VPS36